MVDIDCHACGTLEGATQFAEFLKRKYFPNLYFEVSTNGNGIQRFVKVDKTLWKAAEYKAPLVEVEKWLRRVLRSTTFDVEDVELKGTPLTVSWGCRRGLVANVTFGSLAKMPRDWRRFDAWQSTPRMTAHELRKLPERFAVPEPEPQPEPEPEAETEEQKPVRRAAKGSVLGKLVDPDHIRKLEPLAEKLLGLQSPEVKTASRAIIVAEDLQVTLAIIRSCTLHMNADGSMPVMRIKALWDAVHSAGDTTRVFNFHRFAAIRNMRTDLGLLEWEDATYQFGKACKWSASEKLMGVMEDALRSNTTTTPLAKSRTDLPTEDPGHALRQVRGTDAALDLRARAVVSGVVPRMR